MSSVNYRFWQYRSVIVDLYILYSRKGAKRAKVKYVSFVIAKNQTTINFSLRTLRLGESSCFMYSTNSPSSERAIVAYAVIPASTA